MTDIALPIGYLPPEQIKAQASDRLSREMLATYPIVPGQVVSVGLHTLSCFDLETDTPRLIGLTAGRGIDALYVDPPWGPGLASGFRTKAGLTQKADYVSFTDNLCRIVAALNVPFVIEMGRRWVDNWTASLVQHGLRINGIAPGVYYKTKPMSYIVGGIESDALSRAMLSALHGIDDNYGPGVFLDLTEAAHVFDPCCGMGLTARHALYRNRQFTGNELAPYRAAATLGVLHGT